MKRRHESEEWVCGVCQSSGGGVACPNCSAPRMVQVGGLLRAENEREWDSKVEGADFLFGTEPVIGKEKLVLHKAMELYEENESTEFKECSYLAKVAAYNGNYEQPQDFFLSNDSRWRKQQRASLPEATWRKAPVACQTPWVEYYRANKGDGSGMGWQQFLKEVAVGYPDGRWLAKSVPGIYDGVLVENVVALLNSGSGKGVLFLGVDDGGVVKGFPLTPRQRRTVLYQSTRALLTIHPPLTAKDISMEFLQVYPTPSHPTPLPNHCVIKVTTHPTSHYPLYLHPKCGHKVGQLCYPSIPQATTRRLCSISRPEPDEIERHLREHASAEQIALYVPFFPNLRQKFSKK